MVYKRYNKNYDFRKFETVIFFGNKIKNSINNMHIAIDE